MPKKKSKYESMPEPPCGQIKREYKNCLNTRQQWRKWHAKTQAQTVFNVVGPYVEEDGKLMYGCIGQGLSRRAAEDLAKRHFLERHDYFVGYTPRLLAQIREHTRITTTACDIPRRAEGFDLTWASTPDDVWEPGSSRRERRVPALSGVRKRQR